MTTADIPALAAYLICFVSVAIYAQRRLATPVSNRSSTRARLYKQAELGYIACTLTLFLVLSSALQYVAMNQLLLGLNLTKMPELAGITKLPAPLLATVLLTILLPNVFLIRDVDGWMLNFFKSRANIPQELRCRADRLTPQVFGVATEELPGIARLIEEEGFPEQLKGHLVPERGDGLQLSRYRLTRVLKLFGLVRALERNPCCQKLFFNYAAEWRAVQHELREFCERAATGLEKARKLQAKLLPGEYESLMADRRESFGEASAVIFAKLALLAAGAVLTSEATEQGIGERFRAMGFAVADEAERIDFPLHSLTGLTLALLLFLVVTDLVLRRMHLLPDIPDIRSPVGDSARPFFVILSHAITIGITVWLIQRYPGLQRRAGGRLRWDIYVLCCLLGAAVLAVFWLGLFLRRYGALPQTDGEWNMLFAVAALVGSLCGAVACLCDIDDETWPKALPRRLTEGLCCLAFMALIATLLLAELTMPVSAKVAQSPILGAVMVLLPASVAFIVGSFVPYICRAERVLARQRSGQDTTPWQDTKSGQDMKLGQSGPGQHSANGPAVAAE